MAHTHIYIQTNTHKHTCTSTPLSSYLREMIHTSGRRPSVSYHMITAKMTSTIIDTCSHLCLNMFPATLLNRKSLKTCTHTLAPRSIAAEMVVEVSADPLGVNFTITYVSGILMISVPKPCYFTVLSFTY